MQLGSFLAREQCTKAAQSQLCIALPRTTSPRRHKQLHAKEAVEGRIKTSAAFHAEDIATSTTGR